MKDGCSIIFNRGLADVLGLEAHYSYTESSESLYYSDMKRFYTLYVYCNICEPQVVGYFYVPLLRAVNITGKDGDVITNILINLIMYLSTHLNLILLKSILRMIHVRMCHLQLEK